MSLTRVYNIVCLYLLSSFVVSSESISASGQLSQNNDGGESILTYEVLSKLYMETGGKDWTSNQRWLMGDPCPSGGWAGVVCLGKNVVELSLSSNNLTGTVASELGLITSISIIKVSGNQLSGSIPSQLGMLTHTTNGIIDLEYNSLCGDIPPEVSALKLYHFTIHTMGNSLGTPCCEVTPHFYLYGPPTLSQSNNPIQSPTPPSLPITSPPSSTPTSPMPLTNFQILSIFYVSTVGAEWSNKDNWLNGDPCPSGSWEGISCNSADNTIFEINLSHNKLSGIIPTQLGLLTMMSTFDLTLNSIHGSIPSQLGEFSLSKTWFYLTGNAFNGSLPSEIGRLSRLTYGFDVSSNSLSGVFPSQIGQLSLLTGSLYFHDNSFGGSLPSQIGQLTALQEYLYAYQNAFSGLLPSEIGRMKQLMGYFALNANSFSGSLPCQLGMFTMLSNQFDLSFNSFCGEVPSQVASLSTQFTSTNYDVEYGNAFGTPCCEVSGLAYTCSPTPLSSVNNFQPTAGPLSDYEVLSLLYVAMKGSQWTSKSNWLDNFSPCPGGAWFGIKCDIVDTDTIAKIDLSENNLEGTLPSEFGLLTHLTSLELSINTVQGSLPSQLGQLTLLTYMFDLFSNEFTGSVPSELGKMSTLMGSFYFNSNSLSQSLPSQLGQLSLLTNSFYLQDNSFNGVLPSQLGQFNALGALFTIYNNQFTGLLPSELGRLNSLLEGFEVFENSFSGPLPSQLGQLTELTSQFSVATNLFCGDIPTQVAAMSSQFSQNSFDVKDGNFFGTPCCETAPSVYYTCSPTLVPTPRDSNLPQPTVAPLTNYEILSIVYVAMEGSQWQTKINWLNGEDPCNSAGWFGVQCTSSGGVVNELSMSSNSLKGSFPTEFGLLTDLTRVELSLNNIGGSMPSQLGQLTNMMVELDLFGNDCTGSIPSELGLMSKLTSSFYINDNSFSQSLPSQIGSLKLLTSSFYLQDNLFSGALPSQLGQLTGLYTYFDLYNNAFTGLLPSELGSLFNLVGSFDLIENSFSGSLPSQLGRLTKLTSSFQVASNNLCGDIPSEIVALNAKVANYQVTDGNSFGTSCCAIMPPAYLCEPSLTPTIYNPNITYKPSSSQTLSPSLAQSPTSSPFSQPTLSPVIVVSPIPSLYSTFEPTEQPWFSSQLYFYLLLTCTLLGIFLSLAMGYLYYRRLGRWPPMMRMMFSALAITSIGTEFIFAIAAGEYKQFCSYCPDNTGLVILSINLIICLPAVMYRVSKLKFALDGNATFTNSLVYSPILLLAAFDGDLIVWLPWRDTVATQALSGFPDLSAMAFTAWSILCRKLPFLVFTIKLTVDHTTHGEASVVITAVTLTVTGFSLAISASQRLLRYLGYGVSNMDTGLEISNDINNASRHNGSSRASHPASRRGQIGGGIHSPLLDEDIDEESGGGADGGFDAHSTALSSFPSSFGSSATSTSLMNSNTAMQTFFAVMFGCGVIVMVITNTTPPLDDVFGMIKFLLIAMGFLFAVVFLFVIVKMIAKSILSMSSHEVLRSSTAKKMREDIETKEKVLEEKDKSLVEKDRDLDEQRKREEFIRAYLKAQHGIEIEALLPLEDVKLNLGKAMIRFMGDTQAGIPPDTCMEAEAEVMKWQSVLEAHPDLKTQMKEEKRMWRSVELPRCLDALDLMRTIVPSLLNSDGTSSSSVESLVAEKGLPLSVARRITRTPVLGLCVVHPEDIAKMHPAILRGYTSNGLDLIELRAVFAALPEVMMNDASGEKRAWLEGFQSALEAMTKAEAAGTLTERQLRHPCYADLHNGFGPFDANVPIVKADLIKSSAFESIELRLSETGNVSSMRETLMSLGAASLLQSSNRSNVLTTGALSSSLSSSSTLHSLRTQKTNSDISGGGGGEPRVDGAQLAAALAKRQQGGVKEEE